MLTRAATAVAQGAAFEWGRLDKRLRSHSAKLGMILDFNVLCAMPGELHKAPAEFAKTAERAKRDNNMKMDALYVGVEEGTPFAPSGIFDEKIARQQVGGTHNVIQFFEVIEQTSDLTFGDFVKALEGVASVQPNGEDVDQPSSTD